MVLGSVAVRGPAYSSSRALSECEGTGELAESPLRVVDLSRLAVIWEGLQTHSYTNDTILLRSRVEIMY